MIKPANELIARIREMLDRIVDGRRIKDMTQVGIADAVMEEARELPREGLLEALDKAVKGSKRRRRESVYILFALTEYPEVMERIGQDLSGPDDEWREHVLQFLEYKKVVAVAPLLNAIIDGDKQLARCFAISAAGEMRQDVNFAALLRRAEANEGMEYVRLCWALTKYAREECRVYLQRWWRDEKMEMRTRVVAAWGLGKLGDAEAIAYLEKLLHDPDVHNAQGFSPGKSMRAAQAICDIRGWEFEWHADNVAKVIARVEAEKS